MSGYRTLFVTERGQRHQRAALEAAPRELDVVMLCRPAPDELRSHLAEAVFVISERVGVVGADVISAAPKLKLVLRLGSLTHDIDLDAARAAGVAVSWWPQAGAIAVAEHVMMQILALIKRLREAEAVALAADDWGPSRRTDSDTFAYNWSHRNDIGSLRGKTVGILGFGEIGVELARRLAGWECTVLYHRRRRFPPRVEQQLKIVYAERDSLLAESDIVANLLPYSRDGDQSLGAAQFVAMKHGALFVSCGSGSVVDEAALADGIRAGHLGGVALDTFEWEPLKPDNPLRQLANEGPHWNVVLTPHIAGGAPPKGVTSFRATEYEPILKCLRGEPVPNRLV